MTYEHAGRQGLDYAPCRYGTSRLTFRGPKQKLDGDYIAFLGGTETYGRYVARPFPGLVGEALGMAALNLGCVNAGPDVYLNDPVTLDLARGGRAVVVQATPAMNLSNRFYTVHPRRNDRFLRASPLMAQIFRDVDFTDFSFTRHMLDSLSRFAPERFALLHEELRAAWIARMRLLLQKLDGRAVLLWAGGHATDAGEPPAAPAALPGDGRGPEPLLVDHAMIAALRDDCAAIVAVRPSELALAQGTAGMVGAPTDMQAAAELPNPVFHGEIAVALTRALRPLL